MDKIKSHPQGYKCLTKLLKGGFLLGYVKTCNACIQLIDYFRELHVENKAYHHFLLESIYISPENGNIFIYENNLSVDSIKTAEDTDAVNIVIAPEVARGEVAPDVASDLFILAVLLFQMMFLEHPPFGEIWREVAYWDYKSKSRQYRQEPDFSFGTINIDGIPKRVNTTVGARRWHIYPKYLKDKFIEVFTSGLIHRGVERLSIDKWKESVQRLSDSIKMCPDCGSEMICEQICGDLYELCTGTECNRAKDLAWSIKIDFKVRMSYIEPGIGVKVFAIQMSPEALDADIAFTATGRIIIQYEDGRPRLGIKNISQKNWTVHPIRKNSIIHPGEILDIPYSGTITVNFGSGKAEVYINKEKKTKKRYSTSKKLMDFLME